MKPRPHGDEATKAALKPEVGQKCGLDVNQDGFVDVEEIKGLWLRN